MRRLYIFIIIMMSSLTSFSQNDSTAVVDFSSTWTNANDAYSEGKFQVAEMLYLKMISEGYKDASVYYNLGNVYFQQNQIGKAILNFKRAYLTNPSDEDIKYNLELAQSKTKDKIDKLPSFFLIEWINNFRDLADPDTWAEMSLFFLLLDLGMILLWLLAKSIVYRKIGFYLAIVISIAVLCSIFNSFRSANHIFNSSEAVVTSSGGLIKSSPSENGKDLFVVHEGTSVKVLQSLNGWEEVQLIDGNKGWIISSAIEKVIEENTTIE